MLADGFHSMFDGASNIIGLVGIYVASKPADPKDPYGHSKYETFASLSIGMLLIITTTQILLSAYRRLFAGTIPEVTEISFAIMLVTIVINLTVATYENRRGNKLSSELLVSDSTHTKSDIFVSLSVVGSLIAVRLGYPMLDIVVALAIAIAIGYMAVLIFKESSGILCDARTIEYEEIHRAVTEIEGVRDTHAIRTRGRKNEVYLDLHILVDPQLDVSTAHSIANTVELEVKKLHPEIMDVLVHVEPYGDMKS